jgi:hypothetical protein
MKPITKIALLPLCAVALLAQGPPAGGGGFGGARGMERPDGRGGGRGPGGRAIVTGAPYSATETLSHMQTLAGGNTISTKQQTLVYRDAQGRMRSEETITPPASSGKAAFTRITIIDPVAGYAYELDSATMTGRQMPIRKSTGTTTTTTKPTPPARPNVTVTDLGTQTINGELSTGTQRTETIPAGTIGNAQAIQNARITWISTDLKVPVEIKTTDFRSGNSDMELTNIVKAAPDASLFVVPAGYTVTQGGGRGPGGPRQNGRRGPGPQ